MLMVILKLINDERMFLMLVHLNFISLYDSTHKLSSSSLSPAPQRENTGGENS